MSVFKRKTSKGETKEYHYKFMKQGKTYSGVCTNCFEEKDAKDFEAIEKARVSELAAQKTVTALVENFRDELAGGEKIKISEAFELSLKKPKKKKSSEKHINSKRSHFDDFIAFMVNEHENIEFLSQVKKAHAEEYIYYLREKGRYNKEVSFNNHLSKKKSSYKVKTKKLSPRTINAIHKTVREVFQLLFEDAGLYRNYFAEIPLLSEVKEKREAFSLEELELILEKADFFVKHIFIIGLFTAFREGDICTLKWSDIDFSNNLITKETIKTGAIVEIPIISQLKNYLLTLRSKKGKKSDYVSLEHFKMFKQNQTGIIWRVKKLLDSLEIEHQKKVANRTRAVSTKDVHSLRHTFCYFAGLNNIPLVIVQSIVGHMTSDMTKHYMAHADRAAKQQQLATIKHFDNLFGSDTTNLAAKQKQELINYISNLDEKETAKLYKKLIEK
ncbi:site-specific integrase [Lentisphaerota bacterium WC36G]|nr:site-specific integrase [Lentisphaerae bacterium WC36]